MKRPPVEERFRARIDKTSTCWLWTGTINARGYGEMRWNGPLRLAHRISYELHNGPIEPGLLVCHSCDVRSCVNPAHMFVGTYRDNARDMVAKGRDYRPHLHGERNGGAKLTNDQAAIIRRLRPRGRAALAMAAELGVNVATIHRVILGRTYR